VSISTTTVRLLCAGAQEGALVHSRSLGPAAHARYLPRMIQVRPATASDQESLGRMGGALMRQHHAADPRRFIQVEHPEAGYGRFLVSQLSNPDSLVLVAERAGTVVGYVFADVETTNWMQLRGPCGVVHDIYVDEAARRLGAARELMGAAIAWIRSKGRSQVVLSTMTRNERAQDLFGRLGFRPTMLEMTLDQDAAGDG
jgi:ribosomal protein S18 acetylase RimI-like enzyme